MAYQILIQSAEAEIEVKKSRFIAHALPISSRDDALKAVKQLKTCYPDARHHCWAYLLGDPHGSASAGMDDDGEPSGTAGRPILGVLQDRHVGDTLIVVVRYFGGIKLGAGGLTRAYRQAAAAVLDEAELMVHQPMTTLTLRFNFAQEAYLRQWAHQHHAQWLSWDYTPDGVQASLSLPETALHALRALATHHTLHIEHQS